MWGNHDSGFSGLRPRQIIAALAVAFIIFTGLNAVVSPTAWAQDTVPKNALLSGTDIPKCEGDKWSEVCKQADGSWLVKDPLSVCLRPKLRDVLTNYCESPTTYNNFPRIPTVCQNNGQDTVCLDAQTVKVVCAGDDEDFWEEVDNLGMSGLDFLHWSHWGIGADCEETKYDLYTYQKDKIHITPTVDDATPQTLNIPKVTLPDIVVPGLNAPKDRIDEATQNAADQMTAYKDKIIATQPQDASTIEAGSIQELGDGLAYWGLMICVVGLLLSAIFMGLGIKQGNQGFHLNGKKGVITCLTAAFFIGATPGMVNYLHKESIVVNAEVQEVIPDLPRGDEDYPIAPTEGTPYKCTPTSGGGDAIDSANPGLPGYQCVLKAAINPPANTNVG